MRNVTVKILNRVQGEIPLEKNNASAEPGVYPGVMNGHGAVCVRCKDGQLLGVKPGEFELIPEDLVMPQETQLLDCLGAAFVKAGSMTVLNAMDRIQIMEKLRECNRIVLAGAVARIPEGVPFILPLRSQCQKEAIRENGDQSQKEDAGQSIAEMKAMNVRRIGGDLPHRTSGSSSKNAATMPRSQSGNDSQGMKPQGSDSADSQ